jgi:ADP-heptose:LPS heptosyltransferase
MAALQIYDRRERALVAAGDALLAAAGSLVRPFRRRSPPTAPARILLLRLERIGDLIMALPAMADVRAAAPAAEIHLVVGGWNAELARAVRSVDRVETMEPAWLARGARGATLPELVRQARSWRRRHYDLAINFEPDVRSNLLLSASGARWTAGYRSGGGGALLDQALDYRPSEHTIDNARRLVATILRAMPQGGGSTDVLDIPAVNRREAEALLSRARGPLVAMHVAGGRPVKQWDPDRFGLVARALADSRAATIRSDRRCRRTD